MELAAAATIWAMFSCFLLFPLFGLPRRLQHAAMSLLVAEVVAVLVWGFGSEGCLQRPCSAVAEAGRTAAGIDVPLLALAFVIFAFIRGVRDLRAARRVS